MFNGPVEALQSFCKCKIFYWWQYFEFLEKGNIFYFCSYALLFDTLLIIIILLLLLLLL